MKRAINRFIKQAKTERLLSENTIQGYRDDLRKFTTFLSEHYRRDLFPGDVTAEMIQHYMEFLSSTGYRKANSATSQAKRLAAIRSLFKFLHHEHLVGQDPTVDIKRPRIRYTEPEFLTPEEYREMLKACERQHNPFLALRDKALLSFFLSTGARVSEATGLDLRDLDLRGKRVRLHRKGGEVQMLPVSEELVDVLRRYLRERRSRGRCRAVFISIRGYRLTQQTVATIVSNCGAKARLGSRKITPHTLRHTFATTLLANGENLQTIRVLMNHKNISTTARYLHARDEQLNVAVNNISLGDN
jgi:integrase/recombinase XerD